MHRKKNSQQIKYVSIIYGWAYLYVLLAVRASWIALIVLNQTYWKVTYGNNEEEYYVYLIEKVVN